MPNDEFPNAPEPLDYAGPSRGRPADPSLRAMLDWRRNTLAVLTCMLLAAPFSPYVAVGLAAVALLSSMALLVAMFRYSQPAFGTAYAVRHLVLAIKLLPFFWVDPFLASWLVEADVEKTHDVT